MQQYLVVQDEATGEILPGLPTPRLCSAGPNTDAYYKPPDPGEHKGIWYMKDKGYESLDGTYRRVRVIRNPEYQEYL